MPSIQSSAGRLLAAILLLAAAAGRGADVPGLTAPVPSDPAVSSGILPNGMRYFVRANRAPAGRAEFRLAVNAGSLQEDDDQRGLARFVTILAFSGTAHFPKPALDRFLETAGGPFGPDVSASASFDETVYRLAVPSDSTALLDRAVLLLRDWADGIPFDAGAIELGRPEALRPFGTGRGGEIPGRDRRYAFLLAGSRYAERLPSGRKEILESVGPEALRRFVCDWYRPERAAVVAVGDFDVRRVESLIRLRFASWTARAAERQPVPVRIAGPSGTAVRVLSDPAAAGSSVSVTYPCPVRTAATLSDMRQSLLENLHAAMMNRRLADLAARHDPPIRYGVAGKGRLVRALGAYYIGAGVPDDGVEAGLEALLTEIERVRRHGFRPEEFRKAVSGLKDGLQKAAEGGTGAGSGELASRLVRSWLEGEAAPSAEWERRKTGELLESVTLGEINRLTADWMPEDNCFVLAEVPEGKGGRKPREADLLGLFGRIRNASIEPLPDGGAAAPLVPVPPAPGRVLSEKRNSRLGTVEWKLSNGATVILKPTDFRDGEIRFSAFSPGGNSLVPDRNAVGGAPAAAHLEESGAGAFSKAQLARRLAGTGASVTPSIGLLTEGLSGACSSGDAGTLFRLIHLAFTDPRRDEAAFASVKERLRGLLDSRALVPETAFEDTLQVLLAGRHPRARPWTPATLERMNLDSSLAVVRDRFSDAGDFTFIFAGDFRPDSLRPLVETWLAGLPAAGRSETWRDPGMRPLKGTVESVVRKGSEPKGRVAVVYTGPWEPGALNGYRFETMAGFLRIRLREALAGKLGGAYGVSVSASAVRFPVPSYTLNITFGCPAGRTEELSRIVFREIDDLRKKGPNPELTARVRELQRRELETDLKRNAYWVERLSACVFEGEDPETILRREEWISGLTPDDVRQTANRACDDRNRIRVVLLPENLRTGDGAGLP
ncbi:MAG: insulinase family protein [bacterium]|nr:insulinase family protein [bacterium]